MSAHKYELMFIADPEWMSASEEVFDRSSISNRHQGSAVPPRTPISKCRKLAYEIAGKTEGNYVVVNYSAEPATSDELDRLLNLNESVIRTKILRK